MFFWSGPLKPWTFLTVVWLFTNIQSNYLVFFLIVSKTSKKKHVKPTEQSLCLLIRGTTGVNFTNYPLNRRTLITDQARLQSKIGPCKLKLILLGLLFDHNSQLFPCVFIFNLLPVYFKLSQSQTCFGILLEF